MKTNNIKAQIVSVNKLSVALHLIVWLAYIFLLSSMLNNHINFQIALIRSSVIVALHALFFYVNIFILVPSLYERKKNLLYVLATLAIAASILWISQLISAAEPFYQTIPNKGIGEISPPFQQGVKRNFNGQNGLIFPARFVIGLFVTFLASWLYINTQKSNARKEREIKLKNEKMEAELKILKSQINPHFLFNTLNNIYTLSHQDAPQTTDMIMKLSKMLRYNLYESNKKIVTLQQEVNHIKNYIAFQQLKTRTPQDIQFDFSNADLSMEIAPLIFIPLIENSFKHSYIEDVSTGWVFINLGTKNGKISFEIANSIPQKDIQKDSVGGIGLDNVKRRLELEYRDQYNLTVSQDIHKFKVMLNIYKWAK